MWKWAKNRLNQIIFSQLLTIISAMRTAEKKKKTQKLCKCRSIEWLKWPWSSAWMPDWLSWMRVEIFFLIEIIYQENISWNCFWYTITMRSTKKILKRDIGKGCLRSQAVHNLSQLKMWPYACCWIATSCICLPSCVDFFPYFNKSEQLTRR